MNAPTKPKVCVATTSLASCFGCHMSFLDIDERLLQLIELVEFDRSPLTDIKHCGPCDIGIIEGGVCNAENVHVLREFRANDPELPLLLDKVYPLHEVVQIDVSIPGCPPSADTIWQVLTELLAGRTPTLDYPLIHFD